MENSRESARVDAKHFISYDILNDKEQVVFSGMALSKDLSRRGIKLEDRNTYPVGSTVKLHLAVGNEIVDVMGLVRHVEEIKENLYHIGIEFTQIVEEKMQRIGKYYPEILK